MSAKQQSSQSRESVWPISALLSLFSLLIAMLALWLAFSTQQQTITGLTAEQNQQRDEIMADWQKALMSIQQQLEESRGFMVRQQHYARFMGLLSELYVHTTRQEPAALEETQYRLQSEFNALEPFLERADREWLGRQLKAMIDLSHRLADPLQDYEENLLSSTASLRNLMDETHENAYRMLFAANPVAEEQQTQVSQVTTNVQAGD